jgi:transcription initiation factor IIE alpha subunit
MKEYIQFDPNIILSLRDKAAFAFYVYMKTFPSGTEFDRKTLKDHFQVGVNKSRLALTYLHKRNLIKYMRYRYKNGRMGKVVICLCEDK